MVDLKRFQQSFSDKVSVQTDPIYGDLPVFVEAHDAKLKSSTDEAVAWLSENYEELEDLLSVAGALFLRGFAIANSADFNKVIDLFPGTPFGYEGGGAPRDVVEGKVLETNKLDGSMTIRLHQEMAYLPNFPNAIAFFCQKPPETGGETIIGEMRNFSEIASKKFVDALKEKGVRYTYNFRSPDRKTGMESMDLFHRTWPDAYSTNDNAEVEAICRKRGLECSWLPDGSLSTIHNAPGFVNHPRTGATVWFNSIATIAFTRTNLGEGYDEIVKAYESNGLQLPVVTTHADGSELDEDEVEKLFPLLEEITVAVPWQAGDVMLVDNISVAHGRNPFTGTRNVQVGLLR